MRSRSPQAARLSRRAFLALSGAAPALLAPSIARPAPRSQAGVSIAVEAGRDLGPVPAGLRGFNFWGTRSDAAFFPEYRKIGLGLLRFPPGRTGDENELAAQLMDESGTVARALGAELIVQVRLRNGLPERAAENVRYMNLERQYGAKYWEVGNEPDLYLARAGEPELSPAWYAERFRAYAGAMKAVDPTIKVFGPVVSNEGKLDAWMRPFITACGDIADGLSWHFYPGDSRTPEDELLASTARFAPSVEKIRSWWRDPAVNPGGHRREVPIALSEYAASWQSTSGKNLTTQAAALWTADMLGQMMLSRIDLAAYFALWGLNFHGIWDRRGNIRPVHQTFRLFSQFGDRLLGAESSEPLLASYAARRPDGALSVMVVNKSPDTEYRAALELQGARAIGHAEVWRHAEDQEVEVTPYAGPLDPLDVTFPPYTTTMLVIPVEPTAPELLWGALGATAAATAIVGALWAYRARRERGARKRG
jgi:hypothetical protein